MNLTASLVVPLQKKIWDTLKNAHEGITQVRKFRIARLWSEYEAFKMKFGESLQDMITKFTTVINELISLVKVYHHSGSGRKSTKDST